MYLEKKLKHTKLDWRVLNFLFPKNWKQSLQKQAGKWQDPQLFLEAGGYRLM